MNSLIAWVLKSPSKSRRNALTIPSTSPQRSNGPAQTRETALSALHQSESAPIPELNEPQYIERQIHPDVASLVESAISAERARGDDSQQSRVKSLAMMNSGSTAKSDTSALSPPKHSASARARVAASEVMPTIVSADALADVVQEFTTSETGQDIIIGEDPLKPRNPTPSPPELERSPLSKMPSLPNLPSSRTQGTFGREKENRHPPLHEFSFSSPFNHPQSPENPERPPSAWKSRRRAQSASRSGTTHTHSKSRSHSATPSRRSSDTKISSHKSSPPDTVAVRHDRQRVSISAVGGGSVPEMSIKTPPPAFVSRFSRFSSPIARQLGFDTPRTFGPTTPSTPATESSRQLQFGIDTPPPPVPSLNVSQLSKFKFRTSYDSRVREPYSPSAIPPEVNSSDAPGGFVRARNKSAPSPAHAAIERISQGVKYEPPLPPSFTSIGDKSTTVSRRASAEWSGHAATTGLSPGGEGQASWQAQVSREMVLLSLSRSPSPADKTRRSRSQDAVTSRSKSRRRREVGASGSEPETSSTAVRGRSPTRLISHQTRNHHASASCPPDREARRRLSLLLPPSSSTYSRPLPRPASYTPTPSRRLDPPPDFSPLEFGYIGRRERVGSPPGDNDPLNRHLRREQSSSGDSSFFFGWERRNKKRSMQFGGDGASGKNNSNNNQGTSSVRLVTSTPRIATPPKSNDPPAFPPSRSETAGLDLPSLSVTAPTPQTSPGHPTAPPNEQNLRMASTLAVPTGAPATPVPASEKSRGKRKAEDSEVTPPDMKGSMRSTRFSVDPLHGSTHRSSDASRRSHAPSSFNNNKRARLSSPLTTPERTRSPDETRPASPGASRAPSRSNSQRFSTRGGMSSRSGTVSQSGHRRNLSNSSIPLSALVSPRAPSAHSTGNFHMRDPRRVRIQPTPWTLRLRRRNANGDVEVESSPLQGFLFFVGFVIFPLWWVASFLGTPKTRHLAGSDTEKAQPLDDPQIERDALAWRKRCRVMAATSLFTYIPFIVLVAVFAPPS